ncbi:hypothetical protein LL946_00145 [Knoellia locipacati]|uniref:hypothetical protein n=1 Tax=Knoellia locipacati TaxID=882824 RepID=UPI00384D9655
MHTRRTAVAAATTAALTLSLSVVAASTATSAFGSPAPAGCRLVELLPPPGGFDAGVMDIEVVDGTTVYYGNYQVVEDDIQTQRAVIWRGIDGAPEPVDTGLGKFADIAYELTSTGLVNGASEDRDMGGVVNWVLDITTMELTVVSASSGTTDTTLLLRRVNDSGALVGSDVRGVGDGSPRRNGFSAVGLESATSSPFRLPSTGSGSNAEGINAQGDRVGIIAKAKRPQNPHWTDYDPTLWRADGSVVTMDRVGIDAVPWEVKDDGSAGGEGFWGWDTRAGHMEAVYWPTPDEAVGLGVVDGGAYSRVFGLDEGGWAVGGVERWTEEGDPYHDPWRGSVFHSFLYIHGETGADHLRVLPSLWSVENGVDDWHQWRGSAVHAVNAELDQVASGSDTGLDGQGVPTQGATVYLNASQCGIEVPTTHDPYHLASLEQARAESDRVAQGAARGPRH